MPLEKEKIRFDFVCQVVSTLIELGVQVGKRQGLRNLTTASSARDLRGRARTVTTSIQGRETDIGWTGYQVERANRPHDQSHGRCDSDGETSHTVSVASQVDLAKAFSNRRWWYIRWKITQLRGKGIYIPGAGEIKRNETIIEYLECTRQATNGYCVSTNLQGYRTVLKNDTPQGYDILALLSKPFNNMFLSGIDEHIEPSDGSIKGKVCDPGLMILPLFGQLRNSNQSDQSRES